MLSPRCVSPNDRPTLTELLQNAFVKKHLKGIYFDALSTTRTSTSTSRDPNTTLQLNNLKQQLEQLGISEESLLSEQDDDSVDVDDAESREGEGEGDGERRKEAADSSSARPLKRLSSSDRLRVDALERENYRQKVIKDALARNREERQGRSVQQQQARPVRWAGGGKPNAALRDDPRVIAQRIASERGRTAAKIVRKPIGASRRHGAASEKQDVERKRVPKHISRIPAAAIDDADSHRAKCLARKEARQRATEAERLKQLQDVSRQNEQIREQARAKERAQYKASHFIAGISTPFSSDAQVPCDDDKQMSASSTLPSPSPSPHDKFSAAQYHSTSTATDEKQQSSVLPPPPPPYAIVHESTESEAYQPPAKAVESMRISPSPVMMHAASMDSNVSTDDSNDDQDLQLTEADWVATEQLMQEREVRLKAELQESQQRCHELRRTVVSDAAGSPSCMKRKHPDDAAPAREPASSSSSSSSSSLSLSDNRTGRRAGRLSDRIKSLREKCIGGLGELTFVKVYSYLKESQTHAGNEESRIELQRIFGDPTSFSLYAGQMESLLFMEQSLFDN